MELLELLDRHHIERRGAEHKNGRTGWVQVDCPWCGFASQKFHMGFNLANGRTNCWRCGRKQMAEVLAAITGQTAASMRAALGSVQFTTAPAVAHTGRLVYPTGLIPLWQSQRHTWYLKSRGLDPIKLERLWGLQAIRQAARLAWRVFIPIHLNGETVSWTTRAIGGRVGMRYVAAASQQEAVPHAGLLYGEDYVRSTIIICEGPVDVWKIGPGAVATCGTSYTAAQVLRMSKYYTRVVCFDNNPTAQRQAKGLTDLLAGYPGHTYNATFSSADDAGAADECEIAELRDTFLQ